VFRRLADRAGIDNRYSYLVPDTQAFEIGLPATQFYARGQFPGTARRMRAFAEYAPLLAQSAIGRLGLGTDAARISHLVITCCTGFSAPGLDFQIIERCGFSHSIERTMIGFMGCYAAMNGLKVARHIVRSDPDARVLVVNLELCSLHLQESTDLNDILAFMIFSDGCAASLISAEPEGLAMESFHTTFAPDTAELITWNIGDGGFEMGLSGRVPAAIKSLLHKQGREVLQDVPVSEIEHWAVHPGGRSILDAVEQGLETDEHALAHSREILRRYGNMSSAAVMFVLQQVMQHAQPGSRGCAMSFGPGVVAESMRFQAAA
jgi:alpha-pyrone synthase